MKEEVRIVGIIRERDIECRVSIKEIKRIIYECLQLGPMWGPLIDILEKNGQVKND